MDGLTLGIAVLGAVLGVMNTAFALWRDWVRIRVTVSWVGAGMSSNPPIAVNVVNRSYLAVTIVEVGFFWRDDKRCTLMHFDDNDSAVAGGIPCRLEARSAATFSDFSGTLLPFLKGQKNGLAVKVVTACGAVRTLDVPLGFWDGRFPV